MNFLNYSKKSNINIKLLDERTINIFFRICLDIYDQIRWFDQNMLKNQVDAANVVGLYIKERMNSSLALRVHLKSALDKVSMCLNSKEDACSIIKNESYGWLFVHEDVAQLLINFYIRSSKRPVRLFHHVPKCGGSAISESINNQGLYFQVYANISTYYDFKNAYGTLIVPILVAKLTFSYNPDLIYAGHYSLFDAVEKFDLGTSVVGASVFRHPYDILNSWVRYFWSSIINDSFKTDLEELDNSLIRTAFKAIQEGDLSKKKLVLFALKNTLETKAFKINICEPFVKFYYCNSVNDIETLRSKILSHRNIKFFNRVSEELVTHITGYGSNLNLINQSGISNSQLQRIVSYEDMYKLFAPHMKKSISIYNMLLSVSN